jgi:aconitase A
MIRGTFANIRLRNLIAKNEFGEIKTGGFTKYFCTENDPSYQTIVNEEMIHSELSPEVLIKDSENIVDCKNNDIVSIYEASMKYQSEKTPLVIFAGKDYGSGSSRDWAAKGTALLGVKAVIARSFERIHRSNLVGMGVFPFIFEDSEMSFEKLEITGSEIISIDLSSIKSPLQKIPCQIKYQDGSLKEVSLISNILNESEIETLLFGGIMQKVLTKIYS